MAANALVKVEGDLFDSITDLTVPNVLRIFRSVQIFQWREQRHTKTPSQIPCTEHDGYWYTYSLGWSEKIQSSNYFKEPGHDNPTFMPVTSAMTIAKEVKIGEFTLNA